MIDGNNHVSEKSGFVVNDCNLRHPAVSPKQMQFHFIAGEYPPQPGGVSDYTESIAMGLSRANVGTHVWTRGVDGECVASHDPICVHRVAGDFDRRSLKRLTTQLNKFPAPRILLVQYVPHAFGFKGMNLPFAWWVRSRAKKYGDDVRLMVHEVAYPWVKKPIRHNLLALVNEVMVRLMVQSSSRVYVSTSAWRSRLVRLGTNIEKIVSLPIPSNIPECTNDDAVRETRRGILGAEANLKIVGHFGTFGKNVLKELTPVLEFLLSNGPPFHLHLIGGGSEATKDNLTARFPDSGQRITATGRLNAEKIAEHISACDVMLQPYADGANTRRTSLMACLINSRATVSCSGANCENVWRENYIVALPQQTTESISQAVLELLGDQHSRDMLGKAGREYYARHFSSEHTVRKLLES